MERKLIFEEKIKVENFDGRSSKTKARHASPPCSSGSASVSSRRRNPNCCDIAIEFVCSACLLCICCPLVIVWDCVKLPCKIGWRAAHQATRSACCGSERRIVAAYSSFSDMDSDSLPPKGEHRGCNRPITIQKTRLIRKANSRF